MQFYDAKVPDIVRCSQRDDLYVNYLQEHILSVFMNFGANNYARLKNLIPVIANLGYFLFTSLSGVQTLGEEYTGILRLNNNKIPNKLLQTFWLALYIGGEPMVEKLLKQTENKIKNSQMPQANKSRLLKTILYLKTNKDIFLRLHHSLFYINGKYYNISNRTTQIKYVLLRQWMGDDTTTKSFNLLGKVTFFYLVYYLIEKAVHFENEINVHEEVPQLEIDNTKICIVCSDNRKNISATPCGHIFCWECIFDSLKYQQNCPLCREPIKPSRIVFLQNYI